MTDIEKALAMIAPSAFYEINPENVSILVKGFKAAIEQHEAFRQEVSDAAQEYAEAAYCMGWEGFDRFIIPKPKPDPLAQVLGSFDGTLWEPEDVSRFHAALEALGFEIREKNDG